LRLCGVVLFHIGLAPVIVWLNRRTPKVLLYHACEHNESDYIVGLNSNTTPHAFARHLDFLQQHYQVIALAQLETGQIPDRAVVITFDDGYRSVYDSAYPLLRARGMPATVYLVTSVVNERVLVWVNALNWLLRRHAAICMPIAHRMLGVPQRERTARDYVLYAQTHYDRTSIEATLREMWQQTRLEPEAVATESCLYLTMPQIRELMLHGWSFGSHTARHPNLRCLNATECRAELEEALHFMAQIDGRPSLAYPFGEWTTDTQRIAVDVGHATVMQVGGVNRPLQLTALARVPIPGTVASCADLFAEMEIVTPLLAWAKRLIARH
jgi:peptidoglycan/xylan/chitin deacetylase (PgdA/CDA1 family)